MLLSRLPFRQQFFQNYSQLPSVRLFFVFLVVLANEKSERNLHLVLEKFLENLHLQLINDNLPISSIISAVDGY